MALFRTITLIPFACLLITIPVNAAPEYSAQGLLKFPENYREWVFLSSGLGMTYGALAASADQPTPRFDNVFVNPESYRAFMQTGRWPDNTTLILEIRSSESKGSINKAGRFQTDIMGIEAEVKDKDKWTFYRFPLAAGKAAGDAKPYPASAACYSCHTSNTAVENTFVQFYPQLLEVAIHKGTLKPGYEK